ncbi:MAG TPA: pyridoxamine 5'-phosphate oxidase family protein [Salinimicrobium sp.]|nr:pyridoxamine 5'-phosphate oxidase family protein [Salinimicrobium sp.]
MSTDNLGKKEAREKLKDLVEDIKVGMMVTALDKRPLSAVPMTTKKIDDAGNIWFLSSKTSEHNQNILNNKEVHMLYSDPSDMEFVSVSGIAEIITDKQTLKDLYDKATDIWFDGVDDPNLTAIKFIPDDAYYWDPKHNKYVTLYKLGIAALTGDQKDIGEKGKLDL